MLLNNELEIRVPDGFRAMREEELAKLKFYEEKPELCITDPDRHIIIAAAWKKSGFAALLLSAKEVSKKMESAVAKAMQPYSYALETFLTEEIGGEKAEGFRYLYEAQDIRMIGESFSVKKGKVFYYIHCYLREELREESIRTIREMF